jgi:hypothetical protein
MVIKTVVKNVAKINKGGFYMKILDYIVGELPEMDLYFRLTNNDCKFMYNFQGKSVVDLPKSFKRFINTFGDNKLFLKYIRHLIVKRLRIEHKMIIKPEAITNKHLTAFIILHEIGHYVDYTHKGVKTFVKQIKYYDKDKLLKRYEEQGNSLRAIIRYRKLKLELVADNYAVDRLKELYLDKNI